MKALNLYGPRDLRYEETAKPVLEDSKEVIIKVKVVGICGSDIHRYAKLGPYIAGMTWGHEFSGEIVAVGSEVDSLRPGDRVTACPALYCGHCESCRKGEFARCEKLTVIGARHPGAFAEYVKVPAENCVKLPDSVPYDAASMIEPTSVAIHGLYKTGIEAGGDVAVIGCGTIGLLTIQWAKIFGARHVYALDIDDAKLELAKQLGADFGVNTKDIEPHEKIFEMTGNRGVDIAVESAGSTITSAQVFSLPRKGGKVVFMGIPYGDVMVKRFYFERIVRNELSVYGSWNAISAPFPGKEWQTTVHFLQEGKIKVEPMITHRLSLAEGPATFEKIINRQGNFGKVLFYPEK